VQPSSPGRASRSDATAGLPQTPVRLAVQTPRRAPGLRLDHLRRRWGSEVPTAGYSTSSDAASGF
jgi:hypothetical protein